MRPTYSTNLLLAAGFALMAACTPGAVNEGEGEGRGADAHSSPGWIDGGGWIDARTGGGGGGSEFADASICVAEGVSAEQVTLPVDIIWAVDTSSSMSFETSMVETNLNAFAAQIDSWGIDYRVVMVAERGAGSNEVCVPPPLGGAACADGPRFRHIPLKVGSKDALFQLLGSYSGYQDFLRPDALKHFVVVTDDEATWAFGDNWFRTSIVDLTDPGFPAQPTSPEGYMFHSIVAWGDVPDRGCDTGFAIGQSYLNLTELTQGVRAKVCESDWNPIFAALQDAVVAGSTLPCTFSLPEPPPGESLDFDKLNLEFTPAGGSAITVPRVDTASDCGGSPGWYYDDPANPSLVVVCPSTCDLFTSGNGQVDITSGCATVVVN